MGVDVASAEVAAEERHRAALDIPSPLAGNPGRPKFAARVKRADGSELEVADPRITRAILALMNMNAVLGGAACHWGGPAAFAELQSSVHAIAFSEPDWREAFNIVNDAGHTENGLYALKANYGYDGLTFDDLKIFRSVASKLTGHGEGHLWPAGVQVSNGPLGSSIPVAQGIAMADRLAGKDRVTVCAISDGGMMEGETKEAITAIPGFAGKGLVAPFVLIVSDNNTKLSGRIDADSYSMERYFRSLAIQGWHVIELADGNDLQATFTAVETAIAAANANPKKPVAIWAKTIKGYGVQQTEQSASGGHGYPLKSADQLRAFAEEAYGGPLPEPLELWLRELEDAHAERAAKQAKAAAPAAPAVKQDKIQSGFPKAMIAAAAAGLPVISISADLAGSTGIAPFRLEYPQLSYDAGVAEANMISIAAGFSKMGYIPVVDTFARFGTTKGALPLVMANLSQAPVIAVFSHIGFQDAADGASHQSLNYLAMTGAIAHVQQYCPSCAEEAEWALGQTIQRFAQERRAGKTPDTVLFFVGREPAPLSLRAEGDEYEWGKAMVLADTTADRTKRCVLSANASMVSYAFEAVQLLEQENIGVMLLNNSTPNRPDVAGHQAALAKCDGKLVTVEDHQVIGGAGCILTAALQEAGVAFTVKIMGVQGEFGRSAYKAVELYDQFGFGPRGMAKAVTGLVK